MDESHESSETTNAAISFEQQDLITAKTYDDALPAVHDGKQLTGSSESRNPVTEQWKDDLARIIRRAAIDRYMKQSGSLSEVKEKVHQFEEEQDREALITSLVEEEITPDPTMIQVAKTLSDRIRSRFPQVSGLVLLGSSVRGGARIREATQMITEPDLDWVYSLISSYLLNSSMK